MSRCPRRFGACAGGPGSRSAAPGSPPGRRAAAPGPGPPAPAPCVGRGRRSGRPGRRPGAGGSAGGTRTPQASVTISAAPPMAVVTTGRPACRASTKAMPNGSGPRLGWQWMSAAASSRGTSDRCPRKRTRSATPPASAVPLRASSSSRSCGLWTPPAIHAPSPGGRAGGTGRRAAGRAPCTTRGGRSWRSRPRRRASPARGGPRDAGPPGRPVPGGRGPGNRGPPTATPGKNQRVVPAVARLLTSTRSGARPGGEALDPVELGGTMSCCQKTRGTPARRASAAQQGVRPGRMADDRVGPLRRQDRGGSPAAPRGPSRAG